ncbi:triosephosphate isomerase [Ornithinimicrobium tianjinense]|uniref:Triosephosphate isomerase n=2 Tax=Ornithinimicrobium tianjinense TaxID=1195761 RepID=A0A917BHR5_9MICO|nr:triosephosphate isomerase [Ornithinimicrobium tianjinense]
MTKTLSEAEDFAQGLAARRRETGWPGVQAFVIPSFTSLHLVAGVLEGSGVLVGAQNAHWEDDGAWTGEVSVPQVADAGAVLVEIGHSERRMHFAETDDTVRMKVAATLRHGLTPLVCVGEPEEVLREGRSADFVSAQLEAALQGAVDSPDDATVLVAYEPVWAIGEHGRPARPEEISGVLGLLHSRFGDRVSGFLYGGSVAEDTVARTLEVPHVDGVFVGRSAWALPGFLGILDTAASSAPHARRPRLP